jgi:hypothetical protein
MMKCIIVFVDIMIFALLTTLLALPVTAQPRIEFKDYLWENRPLLLFIPSSDEPAYLSIINRLNLEQDQIQDRDMVIIEVFASGVVRKNTEGVQDTSATELRRRFGVSAEAFTAILIGKDGGVKLRQTGQLDLAQIFALIDSMPMRQQEMMQKNQ